MYFMMRIGILLITLVFSLQTLAYGNILDKNLSIQKKNGIFYVNLVATVAGDYDGTVKRLIDVDQYDEYGIDYVKDVRVVSQNGNQKILWTELEGFALSAKYYSKVSIDQRKNTVRANFTLVPKNGPFMEDHHYDNFSGYTSVEKLPISHNNLPQYKLYFTMKLKFVTGAPVADFLVRHMIRKMANQTMDALLVF